MMSKFYIGYIIIICILFLKYPAAGRRRPSETERVDLWYKRGNTWPPSWHDESDEFKAKQNFREQEIMSIPGADERWENWMQFTQYQLVPKLTSTGFLKMKTPDIVHNKLKTVLDNALKDFDGIRSEGDLGAIYGPYTPKFVDIGSLAWEAADDLKELHEEWGGMKLTPTSSYGIRVYLNGSSLAMHCDKVHSHVISSIVHIGHEYDDDKEPWPLQIEDHDGYMHDVVIEAGEMVFYESARCLHGRIRNLKGRYYASIFIHYKPVDPNIWSFTVEDVIANVPPHWKEGVLEDYGSRWAGQAITVDSIVAAGAPPRYLDVDPDLRDPKSGTPPNKMQHEEE